MCRQAITQEARRTTEVTIVCHKCDTKMQNTDGQLRTLHRVFCECSGHAPPFLTCERRLLEFSNAGFAEDDLRLMLEHIKRVNKKREFAYQLSMRFDKTVGDLERAGDLIGEARADKRARDFKARNSYSPEKASVLRATGRPDAPAVPDGCMTAAEAIKRLRESV